jgi:hypothetical protein
MFIFNFKGHMEPHYVKVIFVTFFTARYKNQLLHLYANRHHRVQWCTNRNFPL